MTNNTTDNMPDQQSLLDRIEQLEARVAALEQRLAANVVVDAPVNDGETAPTVRQPAASAPSAIFLSAPTPDGTFPDYSETEQIGKTIYRLTTDNGTDGHFAMLDSADALATATISVSQFVKPVCRIKGNTHVMPTRVITEQPGTAHLESGAWAVTEKAILRFE